MKRTHTADHTSLELPLPNAVTFDFSTPKAIQITVPVGSQWYMGDHWHTKRLDAKHILCTEGLLFISVTPRDNWRGALLVGGPGTEQIFELSEVTQWGTAAVDNNGCNRESLKVVLTADEVLHRNICSAILDRDLYPHLDSTPFWLKWYFRRLDGAHRERLLDRLLEIQLQVTYYGNDYHLPHGTLPFSKPWFILPGTQRAPDWVLNLENRSVYWISQIFMLSCYLIGRIFLGMKVHYPEYTPNSESEMIEQASEAKRKAP